MQKNKQQVRTAADPAAGAGGSDTLPFGGSSGETLRRVRVWGSVLDQQAGNGVDTDEAERELERRKQRSGQ